MDIDDEKRRLRARFRSLRRDLTADGGPALAGYLVAGLTLLELEPGRDAAAGYWPMDGEADIRPAMELLAAKGFATALPVVAKPGSPLLFRAWRPSEALRRGPHGASEPLEDAPEVEPTLILLPLVAFDGLGFRLGMGGGYYDRTLAALRARRRVVAVGVGHGRQRVDRLPCDRHDQPLDWVLTEEGLEKTP
ncbi:MAG: 5-formyltetrahydrofolate cyclo-ligase [Magnetospirillum sp. WYHS-4]